MCKIIEEHSKSIEDLYKYIALTETYLEDLEKRISELEKSKKYDEYYDDW